MVKAAAEEITRECRRLFTVADSIDERRDVNFIRKNLESTIEQLVTAREKSSDYDESEVESIKACLEKDAINLENVLAQFSDELKTRREERRYVANIYERLIVAIITARNKGLNECVAKLLAEYAYVNGVYEQTRHLVFKLTEEEHELLRLSEKMMYKVEQGEVHEQ